LTPYLLRKGSRISTCGLCPRQGARFWAYWDGTAMEQRGATGGKRSACGKPENGLNKRQTVAPGCHQLPLGSHERRGLRFESGRGLCESPAQLRMDDVEGA